MKTKEEVLFDHYQVDDNGAPVLEDSDIFDAMQEYTEQMLTEYIWHFTKCASHFEAKKAAKKFINETIQP